MGIPKTLLIVDDEEDIRTIIRDSVGDYVERFFEAANGEEALKLLSSYKIHAVITDVKMPVMDGITLLKRMREEHLEIPCTIVTGHAAAYPELRDNAFKWGVQILEKPVDLDLLNKAIRNTIEIGLKLNEISEAVEVLCDEKKIPENERSSFKKNERPNLVEELMRQNLHPLPPKKTK